MPRRYPGQFTARFTSRCPGCDEDILEYDEAVMFDDAAHCIDCAEVEYPGYQRDDRNGSQRSVAADWTF